MNPLARSFLGAAIVAGATVVIGCGSDELIDPSAEPAFLLSLQGPSGTSAVAVAYDAVRVTWKDNSTNESGFQVYRSTTGATGTFTFWASRAANAISFRDTQVAPLKSYCYKIRASRTQDGTTSYSAFSSVACATTPTSPLPIAPSGTVAKPVSSAVSTTWADKSNNEDGFRIQRSLNAGSTWSTAGTVGPNITAFRDNGRTSEQAVCYRVIAFNEHGNSGASNVDCTTPPAKPTTLAASAAAQGGINLTWGDNSKVEDGYQVQRSTDERTYNTIANLAANATSYADAEVTSNTKYWYRVRAKKDGGFSDFSNIVNAISGGSVPGPAAPSGTNATPSLSDRVLITWIDNSDNEEWFRIEQSATSAGPWSFIGTLLGSGYTSYTASVPSEQQVCYRVIALNDQGQSAPSNTDCTTPPATPGGLTATGLAGPAIELKWTDNSSAEDGYQVQRASPDTPWGTIAELPGGMTTYRDGSISGDKTYYYAVRAMKDGGYSYLSNIVSVASAGAPPNAPSDPTAVPTSSSAVEVRWTDNSTNEDGFRVERSSDGGTSWTLIGTAPSWGQPASDAGLSSERQVCYRVTAFNGQGASAPSNMDCTTPPRAPGGFNLVPIDQQTADLVWSDDSGVEDGYEVWYLDGWSFGRQLLARLPANSTSFRLTGDPYWYQYYVVATKDGGYSDFSYGVWSDPP